MKIIVSHDVEHLYWSEHFVDTFILGQFRSSLMGGFQGLSNFTSRITQNRLHNLVELDNFNEANGFRSHYFVAAKKGLNLSYNIVDFCHLSDYLQEKGNYIGLHGQSFSNENGLFVEKERFKTILGIKDPIGIRNHYLRRNDETLKYMSNCGFIFDSTYYGMIKPFKVGDMWEFPISVMECYEVDKSKDLTFNLNQTVKILEGYLEKNMPFFVINFHDIYFNDNFSYYKNWYVELIKHCKKENLEFTTFNQAVQQLNK